MSSLNQNLQDIYNIKLQIKDAIGTSSDVFADYPSYISGMVSPTGYTSIAANGNYDVTTYAYAYVDVQGGGGQTIDPWWGESFDILTAIQDYEEPVTCDDKIGGLDIKSDFEYESESDTIISASWKCPVYVDNTEYTIKVVVESDNNLDGESTGELQSAGWLADSLEDYPDLYDEVISPYITNFTLTQSDDPQTDGYDYLVEGNLYAWNFRNCTDAVEEITENGFYPTLSQVGFNVNVGGNHTCAFKFYTAENSYEFFTDNTEEEGFPCFTYELGTVTLEQDSMLNWHIRADIDTDYFRYADKYCTGYIEVEPGSGSGNADGILVFNDTQGDTIDVYDPNGSEIVMENCILEMRLDEGEDQWLMFLTWDYAEQE